MVLAKKAMAEGPRCPWNSLPRPSNAVMIEGPARGKSAPWCQFVRRTLQAFFAIDLEVGSPSAFNASARPVTSCCKGNHQHSHVVEALLIRDASLSSKPAP